MTVHRPILALDIGGTKTAAAMVGPDGILENHSVTSTQTTGDSAEAIAGTVIDTARQTSSGYAPTRIGIACAGPVNPARGTVSPVNIPAWTRGFPLVEAVQQAFPRATVTLTGDAAAAAFGEYQFGAGRGAASLLGIVVSTGVGGGLVLDGNLHQGHGGNAGHVGHMAAGPEFAACACACGAAGCVEAVASGPSLQAWARAQGRRDLTTERLAAAALAGDPIATEAFDRAARALAHVIVQTSLAVELDVVVIGGGVAQAGDTLLEPLRARIKETSGLAFARRLEVRPTQLRGTAGLRGAAALTAARE